MINAGIDVVPTTTWLATKATDKDLRKHDGRIGAVGTRALGEALCGMPSLTSLTFSECNLDARAIASLMEPLTRAAARTSIVELDVANPMGDEGIYAIADAFSHGVFHRLESLRLQECDNTGLGMAALAGSLGNVSRLAELVVSGDAIEDSGWQSLASALCKGLLPMLRCLNLGGASLGDAGLAALSVALGSLPVLEDFVLLHCTQTGPTGLRSLAEAIAKHASLKKLCIRGCDLGDGAIVAFCSALVPRSARALQQLILNEEAVGDAGLWALAAALKRGAVPRLQTVYALPSNEWSPAVVRAVSTARGLCRRKVRVDQSGLTPP